MDCQYCHNNSTLRNFEKIKTRISIICNIVSKVYLNLHNTANSIPKKQKGCFLFVYVYCVYLKPYSGYIMLRVIIKLTTNNPQTNMEILVLYLDKTFHFLTSLWITVP